MGKTAGSLDEASGPLFFFFPTRVGRGGSHFFFCASFLSLASLFVWSCWPSGAAPPEGFGAEGVLPYEVIIFREYKRDRMRDRLTICSS